MLKPSAKSEAVPGWIATLESVLTDALSNIFEMKVRVLFQNRELAFDRNARWMMFSATDNTEVGFFFADEQCTESRIEHFSRLIRLAQYFITLQPVPLRITRSWTGVPSLVKVFEVWHGQDRTSTLCAAFSSPLQMELPKDLVNESSSQRHMCIRAGISLKIEKQQIARFMERRADIVLTAPQFRKSFSGRMREVGSSHVQLFIDQEVEFMNDADKSFPVTLSLGEIELPLDEVLRLRPGVCIEFEKPAQFMGMLLVGGSPWAAASVQLDERVIKLSIEELEQQSFPEVVEGQETSAEKLRLVS